MVLIRFMRKLLLAVLICAGVTVFAAAVFFGLGNWLLSGDDQPQPGDAIVVLAGDPARAFYAADLYLQGYAPRVYLSRPVRLPSLLLLDKLGVAYPRAEDIDREVLLKKGVPEEAVMVFGRGSLSTAEEARELQIAVCPRHPRLIIVTSPFHVRRTKVVMRDALAGCVFRVVCTPYTDFPTAWWTTQDSARVVVMELVKLFFYRCGGRFYAQGARE